MLVSPAPRTMETANLFLDAAKVSSTSCSTIPVQVLYDGTMQPTGSQLFQKLGYAPLDDYVNNANATDRQVSRALLGSYAANVMDAMMVAMREPPKPLVTGSTLWMVGHAIYLPAAALGVASIVDCDESDLDIIMSCNTKEAEGYLIDIRKSKVACL